MLSCAGYELRVFKCHSWKILLQNIYIVLVYYKVGEVIDSTNGVFNCTILRKCILTSSISIAL